LQHFMFRKEFGSDFSAPIDSAHAMLDVACGTGFWAYEQARHYPRTRIIAFDIQRPHMTPGTAYPENCSIGVGDALETFPYPTGVFSLVMARACSAFIPTYRWVDRLREMYRVVEPGGWLEIRDFGIVISESNALSAATTIFTQLASRSNIYPGIQPHIKELITQAGLPSPKIIERNTRHVPWRFGGSTPGGHLMITDYLAVIKRVAPGVIKLGLSTYEEWEQLIIAAETDVGLRPGDRRLHKRSSVKLVSACIQKPLT
jgi:ubiquinone/menaquinone biosynthesis C-methylase UbiE